MKTEIKAILLAALLAVLTWMAEAVSDYYTFLGAQGSFWQLLFRPTSAQILVRASILLVFVGLGLVAAVALRRRKRAEESLRSSEEKYRELVQNANSIIIRWDCNGILTFFNEFAQNFFGYSEDEVLGKSVIGTIVPETDTAGHDLTTLMMDICNNPQNYEANVNENILKDGRRVWIAWTNKTIFDDHYNLIEVLSVGIDITQQRLAAEALQESKQMLQLVLDTVPARVFWKNENLEYMGCSHMFAVDAGVASPADIAGKTDLEMPWKNMQAEDYRNDDRMVMETGTPKLGYEETQYTAEGRTIWIVASKVPLRDSDGRVIGLLGAYEDITERKRAEEALQASEALLKQFVEHTPAAVAMFDRNMRYLLYSKRWLTDYKLGDRDITGLSHYEVFPDALDRWKQDHQRVLAGSIEYCEEDEFPRADGSVMWLRWELRPWWNEAGEIGGIVMFTEVITDRKQTELALQESEEKYRNLVETTGTGYLIVDSAGQVIEANAEYVRLTGRHSLEEIRGRSIQEWIAPYDIERSLDEVRACLERGFVRDLEIDFITPDGRITPVEINATALGTRGNRRILTLCRDISERKLAEEERHAFEKQMEEHKRRFYRETILSVTDGKLDICGPEEIGAYLANARLVIGVDDAATIGKARHAVEDFCREAGLPDEEIDYLILGVGEAITNAIKHAVSARVYAGVKEDSVWMAVSDKGTGIDSLILPRAVLLRGFSTKPSLGLGYCVMLDVADHVMLNTGEQGTTVVLVKNILQAEPLVSLDVIPDTWGAIGI